MYQMAASGADQESMLLGAADYAFPEDWSRDGWLVYNRLSNTGWDIWAFNFSQRKSRPIVEAPSNQLQARLSPDGRWLAYASNESGVWEVYVQPFPEGRGKWLVSTGGGSQPIWRGNGKELFYVAADDRLVAVPIPGIDTSESASRYSPRAYRRCWRRFAPTMRCRRTVSGFSSTTSRRKRRPRRSRSR
jgi:eukaryotic-like serine/threonine-protein kinase